MDTTQPHWFQFPAQVPEEVDGYQITELLGEGGMGIVFAARQKGAVDRMVAIKFLKYSANRKRLLNRFKTESKSLALLQHPHVAVIHSSALTEAGQPYLVMELVRGEPFDAYCDRKCLTVRERIRLLIQVCSGVTHAHQKGLIHRDLKPGNLLVSEDSGEPIVKIIDFGIAKELDAEPDGGEGQTREGELLGTPYFISPEQANGEQIDTRTDIYSLGVILFNTVTGTFPFETNPQSKFQYLNRLLSEEAPRPSECLRSNKEITGKVCAERQTNPEALYQTVRNDLDWVIGKALHQEPSDRYSSVSEFKTDLERFLSGHPVEARPSNNLYLMTKFAKRHKLSVALGLSIVILLLSILGISLFSLQKIRQSEHAIRIAHGETVSQSNKRQALNDFLIDILSSPSPYQEGRDVRVLDLFKDYEAKLVQVKGQPDLEFLIRKTLAQTYMGLSEYEEALKNIDMADKLAPHASDQEQVELALIKAHVFNKTGQFSAAEDLLKKMRHRLEGRTELEDFVPETLLRLGKSLRLQSRYDAAREVLEEALRHPRTIGDESLETSLLYELGVVHLQDREFKKAEELLSKTLNNNRISLGAHHPQTLENIGNLANAYFRMGRYVECENLHRQVYEVRLDLLGPNHHATLFSLNNLGSTLYKQKRYKEAEPLNQKAVDGFTATLGPQHPDTLMAINNLANVYRKQKDFTKAEMLYKKAYSGQLIALGDAHMETNRTRYNLIRVLQAQGKMLESITYCELGMEHMPDEPWGAYLKAKACQSLGRHAEATDLLVMLFQRDPTDSRTLIDLIDLLILHGREGEIAAHLETASQALESDFEQDVMVPLRRRAKSDPSLDRILKKLGRHTVK